MGVGKTTYGKKLANKHGYTFVDLDKRIEEFANLSVSEIFESKGEIYFREIESKLLQELAQSKVLISTGGGAVTNQQNLDFMLNCGLVIWFDCSIGIIETRVKTSLSKRPLLANIGADKLYEFLENLYKQRETLYQKAHLKFNTQSVSAETIEVWMQKVLNLS